MKTYLSIFLLMLAVSLPAQVTTFPGNVKAQTLTASNTTATLHSFQVFSSNNPVAAVTVASNGYVGIGTADPLYPLHVVGAVGIGADFVGATLGSFLDLNVQFAPIFADGAGVAGHVLTSIDGIGTATWAAPAGGSGSTQMVTAAMGTATVTNNLFIGGPYPYVDVYQKGLQGDYRALTGLSISSGSPNLTAASASFTTADVGKKIIVHQAGTGTDGGLGDELVVTVSAYVSTTALTLAANATVTVAGVSGGIGTDNTSMLQTLLTNNVAFRFMPNSNYFFSTFVSLSNRANIKMAGNGATFSFISANPNSYIAGVEPVKHLFYLSASTNCSFENFIAVNIGQTNARVTISQEGGHYTNLNGVAISYNRHYNKQANSGGVVTINESKYTTLDNVTSRNTGCLLLTVPGVLPAENRGGHVRNCRAEGWALTAVFPVEEMIVENNYFSNESAPALNSNDSGNNFGTSHALYVSSGYGNVRIKHNFIRYVRGTAIQWNTSATNASSGNIVANNSFFECARNGSFFGSANPLEITLEHNTYYNCGYWDFGHPTLNVMFDGENVYGQPTDNSEFKGFASLYDGGTVTFKNCTFNRVVDSGNVAVIVLANGGATAVKVVIANNFFDSACNRSFLYPGDFTNFTGTVIATDNVFGAPVYLVGTIAAPSVITPNGHQRFFFINNIFRSTNVNQLVARFGATLSGNTHVLNGTGYGIEIDLINPTPFHIMNETFLLQGGTNAITVSAASGNQNQVSVTESRFIGTNANIVLNGNTLLKKTGNYFQDTGFDALETAGLSVKPTISGQSYLTVYDTNATKRLQIGVYPGASQFAGIWFGDVTPTANNYGFLGNATGTYLNVATGGDIFFARNGSPIWTINPSGHLLAYNENATDIGASGANRPRNYFGAGYIDIEGGIYENNGAGAGIVIKGLSEGVMLIGGYGVESAMNRIVLGGTTAAFPAIGRMTNGTGGGNGDLIVSGADGNFSSTSTNRLIVPGGIIAGSIVTPTLSTTTLNANSINLTNGPKMFTQTNTVMLSNSASTLALLSGRGTTNIAANRLVVGDEIRINLYGIYNTDAASAGTTLTMRVLLNGSVACQTPVDAPPAGHNGQAWRLSFTAVVRKTGASGLLMPGGMMTYGRGVATASDTQGMPATATFAVDTTAAITVSVDASLSNTTDVIAILCQGGSIEIPL